MATIKGSSTIDWSTIPFDPVNFETEIALFDGRMTEALEAFLNFEFAFPPIVITPSQLTVRLFDFPGPDGTLTYRGTNLGETFAVITSITFNADNGSLLRMTGSLSGATEFIHTLTYIHDGVTEVIKGSFFLNSMTGMFDGGTATSLSVTTGAGFTTTITGDLAINAANNVSGTINGLKIAGPGGTNVIEITGIDLEYDPTIASITTADQLFSVIGPQLAGDDSVSYTSPQGCALYSGAGNDTLTGPGAGIDTLIGGTGNDTYVLLATSGNDVITEIAGEGSDTVRIMHNAATATLIDLAVAYDGNIENAQILGAGLFNIAGNGADNILTGNASINILTGLGGNDVLDGGAGNDIMTGGDGDDTYTLSAAGDSVTENAAQGTDTVKVVYGNASTTVAATINLDSAYGGCVENLQLLGTGLFNVTGNDAANSLTGNASNNVLLGGGENDVLTGNAGNDVLDGGAGNDLMAGGAGHDSYGVDSLDDDVSETVSGAAGGTDRVQSAVDYLLGSNLENLTLVGNALDGTGNALNNILTGNELDNELAGDAGNDALFGMVGNDALSGGDGSDALSGGDGSDVLDGGAGKDALNGGAGDDTYAVDGVSVATYDTVTETAAIGSGTDLVNFSGSGTYVLPVNVENLMLLGTGNVDVTGNALGNQITGNSGNNVLNGGLGADNMAGAGGDDLYILDSALDVVTELPSEGSDLVRLAYAGGSLASPAIVDLLLHYGGTGEFGGTVEHVQVVGTGVFHVFGSSAGNMLIGNASANTLNGAIGNDTLKGGGGNDTLVGSADDDSLDGGLGKDSMEGGTGNDTYTLDMVADLLLETDVEGGVDSVKIAYNVAAATTINLDTAYGGLVENLQILGTGLFNLTGNEAANTLTGNASNNTLLGGDNNDVLSGNAGNDVLSGGTGNDAMDGGAGNDTYFADSTDDSASETVTGVPGGVDTVISTASFTLGSNMENLILTPGALNGTGNTLANNISVSAGNTDNNILDGGGGNDRLTGGLGNDTYVVDAPLDVVVEGLNGGTDTVQSFVTYSIAALPNLEHVTLMGSANINATGNAQANTLTGNSGNNVLDGGLGVDNMAGGEGDDLYVLNVVEDVVTENAAEGSDTVRLLYAGGAMIPTLIDLGTDIFGGNIEGVHAAGAGLFNVTGNAEGNALTGNASANELIGLAGNDSLDGGAGVDTMTGGEGDDTYVLSGSTDVVVEAENEGSDTVKVAYNVSATAVTLIDLTNPGIFGGSIESVHVIGTGRFNLTGNALNNTLAGNASNNVMLGGDGNDTLLAGAGIDTLNGGTGDDAMDGGAGNDSYFADSSNDSASETVAGAAGGVDTVTSTASFTLGANVENLLLMEGANGTGNAIANVITGNAGDNILDGGGGNDRLTGGLGNDTYVVDAPLDVVVEGLNGGTDTVQSFVTYSIAALPNLEHVTLMGSANINATGNAQANTLTGNSGNNVLNGGAGADNMAGGNGNDFYILDSATDLVAELLDEGTDTVRIAYNVTEITIFNLQNAPYDNIEHVQITGTGSIGVLGNAANNVLTGNASGNELRGNEGNDSLNGGAGSDVLRGGDGDDTLNGGGVAALLSPPGDTLEGGAGADRFVFSNALTGTANRIADFVPGEDKILLDNDIFVGLAVGPLNPTAFRSIPNFDSPIDASDRIVYIKDAGGYLKYDANGSVGGLIGWQVAILSGQPTLTASDFLVID